MHPGFFVSPEGNDGWSGLLPEPDAGVTDGPFRTLERAKQAVRERKATGGLTESLRVTLRGGTYFLDAPLVFGPDDSGAPRTESAFENRPARPVIWAAMPGETPVISGGRRITGWREEQLENGKTAWTTVIPEVANGQWHFRQLFVNGSRRMRPRLPEAGLNRIAELIDAKFEGSMEQTWQRGADRFIYRDGDLRSWRNLQDVEITVVTIWNSLHMKIKSLDESKRLVVLDRNSGLRMSDDFDRAGGQYYVENIFEALEEPGQWYLDRPSGKLLYLPIPGEAIETAEVVAPHLPDLVRFEGSATSPVRAINFQNLTFAHTEWQLPPDEALPGIQASFKLPGAIVLRNAQECRFEQCTFEHLANYAIELAEACSAVDVVGCDMRDLGGGGVKMWDGCNRNQVTDCEIGPCGLLYHASVGVLIGRSSGNQVLHNHIHHLFYSGVSIGWNWGFSEGDAYGNVVEWNHIHDFGQGMLSDIGGIYTLGPQPGTRLRYNVIHDGYRRKYGDQGIYLDEGSSDILIEGNLIYRCQCGFSETGRDNIFRNNIFALSREYQMRPFTMGGAPPHFAYIFERNIVYYTQGDLFFMESEGGGWEFSPQYARYTRNLYYNASGAPLTFRNQTLEQWQEQGRDIGSLFVDPLFVHPDSGDFRLQPGSPAFALGFSEVDWSAVGPRTDRRARSG